MNLSRVGITVTPLVALCFITLPLRAQPLNQPRFPNPLLPSPSPNQQLPAPQLPPSLKIPPSVAPPSPQIPQGIPGTTIRVRQFKFMGNQVITDQQLEKVVAPYVGRDIDDAQLQQAVEAINTLYIDAGYITSGAFIPARLNRQLQPGQSVVLTVRVIEGQIEQIKVIGTDRLRDYVRARLKRGISPALNEKRLLESLRLLQGDPLIQSISAQLAPGSRVGQSILNVRFATQFLLSLQLGINNNRSPAVGSIERRVGFVNANVFGLGDRLELGYFNTDGSNAGVGSYTVPFNARGGTIQFAVGVLDSKIVESPFNQLDILSNFRSYDLTVRQPLLRSATERSTREFALGLTASRQESEASLLGTPFPLSTGADEQGRTRISALRFFQEYIQQSRQESLSFRSQFSLGLDLASTVNTQPPDSRFFSWRGEGQYTRLLRADMPLLFRIGVQTADRDLVPIEQLSIGGPDTVRGYRKDLLLANSGAFGSLEARVPLFRSTSFPGLLQIAPFFDFGTSFGGEQGFNVEQNDFLASVGLGLQWQTADRLFVRLDYGIPLVSVTSQGDSLQEQGFSFSILYNPF